MNTPELHNEIIERLAIIETTSKSTLEQAKKTNGRVTKLEDFTAEQDKQSAVFRARIYTAVTILTFLVGSVIVPLVGSYIATGRW